MFGIAGLILGIINYNYDIEHYSMINVDYSTGMPLDRSAMETARFRARHTQYFRISIAITTAIALYNLLMRHYYKLVWIQKYFVINSRGQENLYYYYNQQILGGGGDTVDSQMIRALRERRLLNFNLIVEMIVMAAIPIPYYEVYIWSYYDSDKALTPQADNIKVAYFLSDYLLAIMFFRLFFLLRCFLNYSNYTDAHSKRLCQSYGLQSGVRFAVKCHFTVHPETTVMITFFSSVMISAYVIRIFELPYHRLLEEGRFALDSYFSSFWLVVITITTVGYGDITPKTVEGKMVALVSALTGAFLLSIFVLAVTSVFQLNEVQSKAMRHIKMSRSAAKTITKAMRFYMIKKKYFLLMSKNRVVWNQDSEFLKYIKSIETHGYSILTDDLMIGSSWKKQGNSRATFQPVKKAGQMRRLDSEIL